MRNENRDHAGLSEERCCGMFQLPAFLRQQRSARLLLSILYLVRIEFVD